MKRKGFTLVELLAVISLLAIIALIATPIISDIIRDSKREVFIKSCENIENAAELYVTNKLDGIIENEAIITAVDLQGYVENMDKDEYVIVTVKNDLIHYHYTGRDNNPYDDIELLKEKIENNSSEIVKNVTVNGHTVNKVIGSKTNEETLMNNYVWYSGQLWQVVETNDARGSIKLATANAVAALSFGATNDWDTSWVREWLNEVFIPSLERKDLLVDTLFCLDDVDVSPSSYSKMSRCTNEVEEKVGLLTYEDYIYALTGTTIADGGSFLDEVEVSWLMTPTSMTEKNIWKTVLANPGYISRTTYNTNGYGAGVRAVISIKDNVNVESGDGTKANPYILTSERVAEEGTRINNTKVGDYVYLNEVGNPYVFTEQEIVRNVTYNATKDKVMYRVVAINDDGTVKVERASILKNLPNTISPSGGIYMPYYSKNDGTTSTNCLTNSNAGCSNHNIFNPNDGSGDYTLHTGDSIGYFLNNATNSFYNWYSDKTKSMLELATWDLPILNFNRSYKNQDDGTATTYPNRTNDGTVEAYVGLPAYGDMYTGMDQKSAYWFINRYLNSSYNNIYISSGGYSYLGHTASTNGVRPVVVLKSNVYIDGGEGTMTNPYTLDI